MASSYLGKLFLFIGASSAGKTAIISAIAATFPRCAIHKKATTRAMRPDDVDVYHMDEYDLQRHAHDFILYRTNGGVLYGIDTDRVAGSLKAGENVLLICTDIDALQKLRGKFGDLATVLFVHRELSPEIKQLMRQRAGGNDSRLERREQIYTLLEQRYLIPDYFVVNRDELQQALAAVEAVIGKEVAHEAATRRFGDLATGDHFRLLAKGSGSLETWMKVPRMTMRIPMAVSVRAVCVSGQPGKGSVGHSRGHVYGNLYDDDLVMLVS